MNALRVFILVVLAAMSISAAHAQPASTAVVVSVCGTPPSTYNAGQSEPLNQDTTGTLCTKGGGGSGGAVTIADGADVTQGSKADAKNSATDTTAITLMQVFKEISYLLQNTLNVNVTNANSNGQATMANSSPVVIASDQAAVAVKGGAASGASLSGNPVPVAVRGGSTSDQTAVTDGQAVVPEATPNGKLVTQPWALTPNLADGGGSKTDNSALTILAASGSASLKEYLTSLQCSRTDAGTTAISVAVSDGTKTRTFAIPNSGGGGGNNVQFVTPIVFAANTAITATASSGVTTLYCNAEGFYAP